MPSEPIIDSTKLGFQFDNTYARLPEILFTRLAAIPVAAPQIMIFNDALAKNLGLDFSSIHAAEQAALLSGNLSIKDSEPLAQAYAGHQYGHFTLLGDGRALLLGEHITPQNKRVDIQFKGSGQTPYSRQGDGRAALAPMLREYIISEAMHALGIPTTRGLAVVTTGEQVYRETPLLGAILTRVAGSHIRVGTFEYAAIQKDKPLLETLIDYTLHRHYPNAQPAENKALALLNAIIESQTDLITHWMRVGFIHGVMNTDNMALSGETIDYGPCAFMDTYDPATVFSSIDRYGRYAYANQPKIAQWNIAVLATTLLPCLHDNIDKAVALAENTVNKFSTLYQQKWLSMMRSKLGLVDQHADDARLIQDLLTWMQQNKADYTLTFYDLMTKACANNQHYDDIIFQQWHRRWTNRLGQNERALSESLRLMRRNNPVVIPRNHQVEQALKAISTEGDSKPLYDLLDVLKSPYQEHPNARHYQSPPTPSERVYQTFCGT